MQNLSLLFKLFGEFVDNINKMCKEKYYKKPFENIEISFVKRKPSIYIGHVI